MIIAIASETGPRSPIAVTCERPGAKTASIEAAIAQACDKIAPLWPLKHFVAVNPFLGFSDQSFAATCATLRSEEHTSELQSLMRISYAVFCLKKKRKQTKTHQSR